MKELKIISKSIVNEDIDVYDIEVENDHYYLINNNIISHNSYFPTNVISGGSGAQYPMSQIIELSKRQDKEEKETIGVFLKAKMHKSRITREGKSTEVLLNFSTGISRYYGLIDLAVKYGLFKSITTRIELPDGTKTFGKTIMKNPEHYFTKEILEQLNVFAHQEFMYGIGNDSSILSSSTTDSDME